MNLKTLIKNNKFDYVNDNITPENFPEPKEILSDYKLFHFDRYISSNDAEKKMLSEGYRSANLYELLNWKDWNGKDWVVALGSVAEVGGCRGVPCLGRRGAERGLDLNWRDYDWGADDRFLAVRLSSESKKLSVGNSDALTLESAIKLVKENGYQVAKIM